MADIVVIGASAGGIEPLEKIVGNLPADFRLPIMVVVHVPEDHKSVLPQLLERAGSLRALHPFNGQNLEPGVIYVAPPGYHMIVIDDHLQLKCTPRENRNRPAIDPLFRSAAEIHGSGVIGVILSGVLDDGTAGLLSIKQHGGIAIAQDPNEAMYPSMPESACRYVDVDHVLPATQIAEALIRQSETVAVGQTLSAQTSTQDRIAISNSKEVMMHDLFDQPGTLTPFACPECSGNLWTATQNGFAQYWCHIGHRYTKRTLLSEKSLKAEAGLFEAFRALKESVAIAEEIAQEAGQYNDGDLADELQTAAENWKKQLSSIYKMINK